MKQLPEAKPVERLFPFVLRSHNDSQSVLPLLRAEPAGTNVTITWHSVAGLTYLLERTADLRSPFTLVATNMVGQSGATSYADPNAASIRPAFYRVGVTPR